MASDPQTGSFLRALAASKPAANLLELGTGTGLSAAWLLDGMDATSQLDSVEYRWTGDGSRRKHSGA